MHSPEDTQLSPVIIRRPDDEDLLAKLTRKNQEYLDRIKELGEFKHPEQLLVEGVASGSPHALDAMLKHRVLSQVLEAGEVNTWDFSQAMIDDPLFEIVRRATPEIFVQKVSNACGVIEAYCLDDMTLVSSGTGLQ